VFSLRQKLIEKTAEVDSVRRELDRVLIQLREKDGIIQLSETTASRRAQVCWKPILLRLRL
jgi:hypothetical protein